MPKSKGIYRIFKTKADLDFHELCIKTIMQQQTLDIMVLTIAEMFDTTPETFKELQRVFESKWAEMCSLSIEDVQGDKEIWYTKATIDRALRAAVGDENFKPWEERYKL